MLLFPLSLLRAIVPTIKQYLLGPISTDAKSQPKSNGFTPKAPEFAVIPNVHWPGHVTRRLVYFQACYFPAVHGAALTFSHSAANLPSDCINLGQGYTNFPPPQWIRDAADVALNTVAGNNYSHPKGRLRLREAIRDHYSKDFNRILDVEEILVTGGAIGGLYSVCVAFLEPGDEVILFEPYFDQFLPSITFNHGVPVYVPLHPPTDFRGGSTSNDWTIDFDELRRAITPKTKMILVNTPLNPVGKVFAQEELQKIADLSIEHNIMVLADEVYDCVVFDNKPHIRIASLPGMWERTITVGSASKSFTCSGWRVAWLIGPKSLIGPSLAAQSRIVFAANSPLQEAVAAGLEEATKRGFFQKQVEEYQERRDVLLKYFDEIGLKYSVPFGSYYILVDVSDVQIPDNYPFPEVLQGRGRDFYAAWLIAQELKVSTIPVSEFYCDEHMNIGERFLRFAFCKDSDTLHKAGERLRGITKLYNKEPNTTK